METLSKEEIRIRLKYLKDSLPNEPTAVKGCYSLPKAFNEAFNGPMKQKEFALQQISDHMGYFLGLIKSVKVIFVEKREDLVKSHSIFIGDNLGNVAEASKSELFQEERYAGLYKITGYDHREITIVNDRTFYLIHFLSVLAHEVTHNYLYHHQVTSEGRFDSEVLTDLAAIYLGFGGTILRGYAPSSAISCRLGYIDVATIRRAILKVAMLRGWSAKEIGREFPGFDGFYFQLHSLPRSIFRPVQSEPQAEVNREKRIILCSGCRQKLRIPKEAASLKVKCPKCGFSFLIGNNGYTNQRKNIKMLAQDLIVSAFGLLTSVLTSILLVLLEKYGFPISIYTLSLWAVIPVGAVFCGFVASSGCYYGARLLNHRPTLPLLLNMAIVSVFTFVLIHYWSYVTMMVKGVAVSERISFLQYLDIVLQHKSLRSFIGPRSSSTELGQFGFIVAFTQIIGFGLGGVVHYLRLLTLNYCKRCLKYWANTHVCE